MKNTLYDKWTIDFRKILFCIGILALGTLYNVEEPNAFAIAVIVQGISNVDNFWDYLDMDRICLPLKILNVILILFSITAAIFAFYTFSKSKGFYDINTNQYAGLYIFVTMIAVGFPIVPLIVDTIINIKLNSKIEKIDLDGGDEDEL